VSCRFYKSASDAEPLRVWLKCLSRDARREIGSDILKVQRMWPVSRPLVGSFGDGLYEVVTSHRRNEYRVIFCIKEATMVLLHGFQKKIQKTPTADLDLARRRRREVHSS